jgi:hypothetical protein
MYYKNTFDTLSTTGPASYPMGTGALSLDLKRPGREADHSPPSSAEFENAWSYTSTPQYVFMAWCLVKHRDNFIFYQPQDGGTTERNLWTDKNFI